MKERFAKMKKSFIKHMSIVLCALIAAGGVTAAAYSLGKTDSEKQVTAPTAADTASSKEDEKLSKDETVYVLAGADGSVKKIIVSDWIKNALGTGSINDKSELDGITNVKGDEGYTMNGDNLKVWDAAGNDIYYRGNINKDIPVNLTVSYTLDGKNISAEELKGKNGKVTIRFGYENKQYETVKIDGKDEKIYVPFAMLTGVLLDNDVFTNVTVSNGKYINDGDRTAVIGIALPGMAENLALTGENAELIPSYVEITADVKNFELGNTVTVATNEIFNAIDTDNFDSLDSLTDSVDSLADAVRQLTDGSSKLYDGICTLLTKSQTLVAGIDSLAAGAEQLKAGTGSLKSGADALKSGTAELVSGLGELTDNNEALKAGSKKVFNTLLTAASTELKNSELIENDLTIENYSLTLDGVVSALDAKKAAVYAQLGVETDEQYTALVSQVKAGYAAGVVPAEKYTAVMTAAAGVDKINEGKTSVTGLKTQLDEYNTFYIGIKDYTDGASKAEAGAKKLDDGAGELVTGAKKLDAGVEELYKGIITMKDGTPALVTGVTELKNGAMQLKDGLKEFSSKGVDKLVEAAHGDVAGLVTRFKATVDVSKDYKSFSGITDEMDGNVKFIYRTDAVKAE